MTMVRGVPSVVWGIDADAALETKLDPFEGSIAGPASSGRLPVQLRQGPLGADSCAVAWPSEAALLTEAGQLIMRFS